MLHNITDPAIRTLNRARIVNNLSSPNMVKNYVAGLVAINGTTRIIAAEMDNKEKPAARHYAAGIAGLQEVFALGAHFLLTPMFAVGGLLLGKHLMAKKAFKNVVTNMNLSDEQIRFMREHKDVAVKSAKKFMCPVREFIGNLSQRVQKALNVDEINKGIRKIHEFNGTLLKTVRNKIDDGVEVFVQKAPGKDEYAKMLPAGKKGADNIMRALEGMEGYEDVIVKQTFSRAQVDEMKGLAVPTMKFIANNKTTHNNVLGSQKLGEALGMTTALTIISPLFSIKLVPTLLEKLGLSKEKITAEKKDLSDNLQPKFNMALRLKQQGFEY